MLNSIGLQGPGIEALLADTLPRLAELGLRVWVSVGGFSAGDYAGICERLEGRDDVEAIELNLSCPNVDEAPESAAEIVAACRAVTGKPLYAKLSPATSDIAESARAVVAAGADGLSLVNTIRGLALDPAPCSLCSRAGYGRVFRSGPQAGGPGMCLGLCRSGRCTHRRDGGRAHRARCAGARRSGCSRCRAGHRSVRRSGRARPRSRRAGDRGGGAWLRQSGAARAMAI